MIYIAVALPFEGRPIIERFGLKRNNEHRLYEIYSKDNISLIITGTGSLNAACAVTYACENAASKSEHIDFFINIGTACGGPSFDMNRLYLINKITSKDTGKSFYPSMVYSLCGCDGNELAECSLVTSSSVSLNASDLHLTDMEGYGFYHAALKYLTSERIVICKVKSDEGANTTPSADTLREAVAGSMPDIYYLITSQISKLMLQRPKATTIVDINAVINKYNLTDSMISELLKLAEYAAARGIDLTPYLTLDGAPPKAQLKSAARRLLDEIRHAVLPQ